MSAMPMPLNAISGQYPKCNDENLLESISGYYQRIVNCLQNSSAFLQVIKSINLLSEFLIGLEI